MRGRPPDTNQSFWASLKNNLGALVDRVYLQGYAGGAGNNPASWSRTLGITGGFVWLYDDMKTCSARGPRRPTRAIRTGVS